MSPTQRPRQQRTTVQRPRLHRPTLHRPTVVRAAVLCAALALVGYTTAAVLAPALVEALGVSQARVLVLVGGSVLRLLAGRWAARATWQAGGDARMVVGSVAVGAVVGWVVFPGLVSVVGLLGTSSLTAATAGRAATDVLWAVSLVLAGALTARWEPPQGWLRLARR